MTERRVIDAHVHFWDPAALHYPWLVGVPELQRTFLPADLQSRLDGVVCVEGNCLPAENLAEADFVDSLGSRILGFVAFVDLCDPRSRQRSLELLSKRERVVGVRHNIQGQAPGFCLQREFVRGVAEVGVSGLPFDLCITADQLADATELVRRNPTVRFVLDHCGKPAIRNDAWEPWSSGLAALAEHENVACKLSGLLTEARPHQRTADRLSRYARHALQCFGAARLMYGSDWPVATMAGGEALWRGLIDTFISDWTSADRHAFFFENVIRFYGLRTDA